MMRQADAGSCQQREHENFYKNRVNNTKCKHHADPVSDNFFGCLFFSRAQMEGETGGASDSDQERNGEADRCQRIGDIRGGIAEISYTLSDKDLIDDIIQGTDQHGDDAGNRESSQKRGYTLIT